MFDFNLRNYYVQVFILNYFPHLILREFTVCTNYSQQRKKYNCDGAFPHVYEKISKLGRK